MKQCKRIVQIKVPKKGSQITELQKEFIIHNFQTHQRKKKIALSSPAERYSEHVKDPGCLADSASPLFSSAFLEFAFCTSTVPAQSGSSVNGSYQERLLVRPLGMESTLKRYTKKVGSGVRLSRGKSQICYLPIV